VLIPCDDSQPLQPLWVESEADIAKRVLLQHDEIMLALDEMMLQNVIGTLLVRSEGLYAHHNPTDSRSISSCGEPQPPQPNIRATRLAMACGRLSLRLRGNVIVSRRLRTLQVEEISAAACASYDLRRPILEQLLLSLQEQTTNPAAITTAAIPLWLTNASRENYHDAAVLQRLATVMTKISSDDSNQPDDHNDDDESSSNSGGCDDGIETSLNSAAAGDDDDISAEIERQEAFATTRHQEPSPKARSFVTTVPLCLECRRPASDPCPNCEGAYFCAAPALCRAKG